MNSHPNERFRVFEDRLAAACRAAGRARDGVLVVAVSKRHPDEAVTELAALGQQHFGENVVQAWRKRLDSFPDAGLSWHLIGPMQTNKAKFVARGRPYLIHTVDRPAIVEALERRLAGQQPLDALIQVNLDAEAQKAGCPPDDLDALVDRVAASDALTLRGLMCIPRPVPGGAPRAAFARLRELADSTADRVAGTPILSMGMSDDFEAAIAEGSTLIRVGTVLFGPRPAA